MITTRKSKQLIAAVAGFAIAATGLLSTTAEAVLPANSAPNGIATIAPASGTKTSTWGITLPGGAACAGDSATGNYTWSTFFVANSVDASQLTWAGGNPASAASPTAVVLPLFSSGTPITNQNTAIGNGAVTVAGTAFDLITYTPNLVPAGLYKVGVACVLGGATPTTEAFWQSTVSIAVDGAGVITGYSPVVLPGAPTLASPLTAANGSLSGTFTAPASTPATLSYLVTATPASGPAITTTVTAPASSFTISGLANGTTYSVTVKTTNAVGTGAASNAVSGTPSDPNQQPAVGNLGAAPGTGLVTLTWTAPPTGPAPTGYAITVSPTVAGAPFTAAAGALSFPVTGLTAGTLYTFTVTPNHTAPNVGTTSAPVSATPYGAQVVIQDVTVVRPPGALVLTQRCGVNGPLPIEPASPGFAQLPAVLASVNQIGTAPTLPGGGLDPQFSNYPTPSPFAPETHCGVSLGTAQFVASGPLAGQYYAASGFLNQVTVSDTRDTDTGWTVNGTMGTFTVGGGGATFSGNQLGWTPSVTSDSAITLAGYDQIATPGANVLPATAAGLGNGKPLASAAAGHGLGIASFDARLKLLIPVAARAGTYTGTLTFTVV